MSDVLLNVRSTHIVQLILEQNPDVAITHIGSNNVYCGLAKDINIGKLADEIVNIGTVCRQLEVNGNTLSSILLRNR